MSEQRVGHPHNRSIAWLARHGDRQRTEAVVDDHRRAMFRPGEFGPVLEQVLISCIPREQRGPLSLWIATQVKAALGDFHAHDHLLFMTRAAPARDMRSGVDAYAYDHDATAVVSVCA